MKVDIRAELEGGAALAADEELAGAAAVAGATAASLTGAGSTGGIAD